MLLRRPRSKYEGRGRCKLAISWPRGPRPKQTRNTRAQRAGAEIDPGYRQFGYWLVGGEPWLREPAHPGADTSHFPLPADWEIELSDSTNEDGRHSSSRSVGSDNRSSSKSNSGGDEEIKSSTSIGGSKGERVVMMMVEVVNKKVGLGRGSQREFYQYEKEKARKIL